MRNRLFSLCLSLIIFFSVIALPAIAAPVMSDWAKPELEKAQAYILVPNVLKDADFTKPITRAEFAAVSVKLYENLAGKTAVAAVQNPFSDTSDPEVLKAYSIGLTAGTSAATFSPDTLLNREQAATMLTRSLKAAYIPGWTLAGDNDYSLNFKQPEKFDDDTQISEWAKPSVYYANVNNIISGTGGNMFSPQSSATREQALAIAVRIVDNLKGKSLDYNDVVQSPEPGTSVAWNDRIGVKQISSGSDHTLCVKDDGSLWAWGENNWGQLGTGDTDTRVTPEKIMVDVLKVSAGGAFSAVLKNDGSLWTFGSGSDGQLGDGNKDGQSAQYGSDGAIVTSTKVYRISPYKVMDGVSDVAVGLSFTLVKKNDGSLWGFGYNMVGQLGFVSQGWSVLESVKIMDDVKSVFAGADFGLAVKNDGSLWTWGGNSYGQLGNGSTSYDKNPPTRIMDNVKQVFASADSSATFVITNDANLWVFGYNSYGKLGDGSKENITTPKNLAENVIHASAGDAASYYVTGNNELFGCGWFNSHDGYTKIADGVAAIIADNRFEYPRTDGFPIGDKMALLIKTDGSVWTWTNKGSNQQLSIFKQPA